MKHGRSKIICKQCNKEKLHYGLGFCSACLRNHKRKTRPSFYLGTCYSEMSRRYKTYDPKRPRYVVFEKCSKEEFINKFLTDPEFLRLYKLWQDNNYERKYSPSIDRIDNEKGYTLDNIQFLQHNENGKKDWQYNIKITFANKELFFESQKETAEFLGVAPSFVCVKLRDNGLYFFYKGMKVERTNA